MSTGVAARPIDDFSLWLAGFSQPGVQTEALALVVCFLLALGMTAALRRTQGKQADPRSVWFGARLVDGVLFPLLLLGMAYVARALVVKLVPLAVFKVAIPVLVSLVIIRVGVKVMRVAFEETPWVRAVERTISWVAWLGMVLWVSGLLPVVLAEMDQIAWKVGGSQITLRNAVEGAITAGAVLIVTLWISSAIEARLLRSAVGGGELSLRKAISNATRALLMFVGLLLALSAVGIDLTALSVLGGAVGVGIGLGLQRLAANYVSGFVILAERSMRIGDVVRVDTFEGRITDINARYTVIRALSGREAIVPNEALITSRVENLSLSDPKVWQSTVVSVAYDSDVELVTLLLLEAASAPSRVLTDPGPSVAMTAFGADGLEFTVGYWLADPENGQNNLKSEINHRILRAFRDHGIDIPFPQRVVHQAKSAQPETRAGVA